MNWKDPQGARLEVDDGLLLRGAESDDLGRILEIEGAAHPTPWSRKVFEKELELEWSNVWVAESADGEVAAFLVFWVICDEVHILNVAVAPRCRRRGIGSAILTELIRRARKNEMSFLNLEVRVGNVAARSMYESLGFDEIARRSEYYKDTGEDAIVMSRIF